MPHETCKNCETECSWAGDDEGLSCQDWTGPEEIPDPALVAQVRAYADTLEPPHRLSLFDLIMEDYCCKCGGKGTPCHCEARRSH